MCQKLFEQVQRLDKRKLPQNVQKYVVFKYHPQLHTVRLAVITQLQYWQIY